MKGSLIVIFVSLFICQVLGQSFAYAEVSPAQSGQKESKLGQSRRPKYFYSYFDRSHERQESLHYIAAVYAMSWGFYPLTQPKTFMRDGSFRNYRHNFGRLVFDQDEPFWNWFVHPLSGSQLYLFYRANGYSRSSSLGMSFISSTLFEFTVEIYSEPASVQDLYQTPILGAVLGMGLEGISMYLLNTGNPVGKFFGHLVNPSTLFWFYEGKIQLSPTINRWGGPGLNLYAEF